MEFTEWKPLQFRDMSEINKLTDVSSLKTTGAKVLLSKLDLIFQKAVSTEKEHDMAQAYILYMRYMGAIEILRCKLEYRKDPKYYEAMLNKQHIIKSLERAEFLNATLLRRFEGIGVPSPEQSNFTSNSESKSGTTNSPTDSDSSKLNNKSINGSTSLTLSDDVEGIFPTDLFLFIICFLHGTGNAARFSSLPSVILALAQARAISASDVSFSGHTLSLSAARPVLRVLCLDLRCTSELAASPLSIEASAGSLRITRSASGRSKTYTSALCSFLYLPIPTELLAPGITGKQLQTKFESAEDRLAWEQRSDVDLVILMDRQTEQYVYASKPPPSGPLHTVCDALLRWDGVQQVASRPGRRLAFVRGGYQRVVLELPSLVGNYSPALKKYYFASEAGPVSAPEKRLDALKYPQMDATAPQVSPASSQNGMTTTTPQPSQSALSLFPPDSHLDRNDLFSLTDSTDSLLDKYKYNPSASNSSSALKTNENSPTVNSTLPAPEFKQITMALRPEQAKSTVPGRVPPVINRALKPTQTPAAKAEMSKQQERLIIDYMESMNSRIKQLEAHNETLMRERAAVAPTASLATNGALGESKQPPPKPLKRSNSQPDLNPVSGLDSSTGPADKFTLKSGTNAPRPVPLFDRASKPVAVEFSSSDSGLIGPPSGPSSTAVAGDQKPAATAVLPSIEPTNGTLKPDEVGPKETVSGSAPDQLDTKKLNNLVDSSNASSKSSGSLSNGPSTLKSPAPKTPSSQPLIPSSSSTKLASYSNANEELNLFYQKISQAISRFEPVILRSLQPAAGKVHLGATGLVNLGNTCFMNSVIQLLSNTADMREYFLNDKKMYAKQLARAVCARTARLARSPNSLSNKRATQIDLCIQFGTLLTALWNGAYKHISPIEFKAAIVKSAPDLFPYGARYTAQQDAQEFLLFLLDNLHEELNSSSVLPGTTRLAASGALRSANDLVERGDRLWREHVAWNDSTITTLFNGQLLAITRCLRCGSSSFKFDVFMYLSVPIPGNGRNVTIYDCLSEFFKDERLDGESAYNCERCHQRTTATLIPRFHYLPRYLIVILKRFQTMGRMLKVTSQVDFPLEGLQLKHYFLTPEVARASVVPAYRLVGAVNHYGSLESGHYTAFCRSPLLQTRDGRSSVWFKFDDESVTDMRPVDVVSPAAYILLYEVASS